MGKLRARYNEKARSSSRPASQQLHPNARDGGIEALKRKYETEDHQESSSDQRSQHIRQVLNIPTDIRLTSTKKKRLEKYIEKQLKKESRVTLMQKLSGSSIDSSLLVRSSSGISQGSLGATERDRVAFDYQRVKAGLKQQSSELLVDSQVEQVQVAPVLKPTITFGSALRSNAPKPSVQVTITASQSDEESDSEPEVVQPVIEKVCNVIKPVLPVTYSKYVLVERSEEVQQQRLSLPILAEEHSIMEMIQDTYSINRAMDVIVLCGETGSGKSTQLPQFMFEAGYGSGQSDERGGLIAVTQPRRVAAISIAQRIGVELGMPERVSYQVRYNSDVSSCTAIKVATDGILLKEISKDLLLLKYSCIFIDEAHERSLNTDILIGFLSRVVPLRRKMFEEGKSQKLPDGTVTKVYPLKLVIMSATLRTKDFTQNQSLFKLPPPLFSVEARQYPVNIHFSRKTPEDYIQAAFNKVMQIHKDLPYGGILIFLTGKHESLQLCDLLTAGNIVQDDDFDDGQGSLKVLPLYAMQSTYEQMLVFEPIKMNQRLVVVSTNVAETSLTIPGIKYVIDSGRVKEKDYDTTSGVSSFKNTWTSKASANQRAGRAGRTGPGHVYRLYSSVVFEHEFCEYTKPEIQRMSIEGVVLQMKCMAIDNVVRFPFPTQPDQQQLSKAEKLLKQLGALDKVTGRITQHGRRMSEYPVAPRLSCMVINSKLSPHALVLVAMLTVGDPFITTVDQQMLNKSKLYFSYDLRSDFLSLVRMYVQAQLALDLDNFCQEHCLNAKVIMEARQLLQQLFRIASVQVDQLILPDRIISDLIRTVITSSFLDQVAMKVDKTNPNQRLCPYKLLSDTTNEQILYLHPSSSLSHQEPPQFVVFQGLSKASTGPNQEVSDKVYMIGITALDSIPLGL